jgi:hypothetical protein
MRLRVTRGNVAGTFGSDAKAASSMAASRFKLGPASAQADTRIGFGRGSAVREYWLERCHGFSAVGSDGRPLGRVKRIEIRMEGAFLRLTGIRAREVPVAAIDTVWPSASVLMISAERTGARSRQAAGREVDSERPAWEDETLPWWELFADGDHSSTARSAEWRPFSIIASARSILERRANAVATCMTRFIERSRSLTNRLVVEALRSSVRTSQAARSAAARFSRGLAKTRRRARRKLARKLFGIAIWIAGNREVILNPDPQDRSSGFDDEDTAEIAQDDQAQ